MKILKLVNFTTNNIKHINAAEYVISEQTALDESVDKTADEDRGPLRCQWKEEYATNPKYTKAHIQQTIYSDITVGESSTINQTNCVLDQPPFNIIYNETTNICWLITLIHHIRANTEFKNYIFKNCTNDNVKRGLEKLLDIHGRDVTSDEYALLSEYGCDFLTGGTEMVFIMCLFTDIEENTVLQSMGDQQNAGILEKQYTDTDAIYRIISNINIKNQPVLEIRTKEELRVYGYLSVSNAVLGRPNDSKKSDDSIKDALIFNSSPRFLIISIEDEEYVISRGINREVNGIILEKDIYINVKDKEEKEKYSLTGISVMSRETQNNWHSHAIIKHGNQWYDAEYLLVQELDKQCNDYVYELPDKSLADELNMFSRITVDYLAPGDPIFVDVLFYELATKE